MAALFGFDPRRNDVRHPDRLHAPTVRRRGLVDRLGAAGPLALIVGATLLATPLVALIDWLR